MGSHGQLLASNDNIKDKEGKSKSNSNSAMRVLTF